MWDKAAVFLLVLASSSQAPGRPAWEVVRSADGDFAFSMPVKPATWPPGSGDFERRTGTLSIMRQVESVLGGRHQGQRALCDV